MRDTSEDRAITLVVGGFPLMRQAIVAMIHATSWLVLCAETREASVARRLCLEHQPNLVVVDMEAEDTDPLALVKDLTRLSPGTRILAHSERDSIPWLQRCFHAGATGYLSKREPTPELEAALWRLCHGDRYISRSMAEHILEQATVSHPSASRISLVDTLSARELAVFRLIGSGQGPSAIAQSLGVHIKTIETHQHRIKIKLALRSGDELKQRAAQWALDSAA